jgi:hypothetical protein
MANKKNKAKKAKKAKAAATKNSSAMVVYKPPPARTVGVESLARQVCSITDPFCSASRSGKYPDGSVGLTVSYPVRTRINVQTNGTLGNGAAIFVPASPFQFALDNTISTPGAGVFSTTTDANPFPTGVTGYRINSWGLRLRNTATPLTSSGMVRIRGFPNMTGATLNSVALTTYAAVFSEDIPLRLLDDVCIMGHRLGKEYTFFLSPTDTMNVANTLATWNSPGWGAVTVYLEGGPVSSTCIDVEILVNYELSFNDGDASQFFATPTKEQNTIVQQAQGYVAKAIGNVIKGGVKVVESIAYSKAKQYIVGALMGPTAGSVAAITNLD